MTGVATLVALALATALGSGTGAGAVPPANRLADASSPYLLLHADDPVAWYPWGPEAFARARFEGRPIFLSIGYSACYWCHVMEREVFSDPEIAALMNRWFVNVIVDREERPDVDEVYLTATQLLAGSSGWPASLFLTPALEPFFAGSYFPPAARGDLPGFPTILRRVHDGWSDQRRSELEALGRRVVTAVEGTLAGRHAPAAVVPPVSAAAPAVAAVKARFDPEWGGFAPAPAYRPKFPRPGDLLLLVEAWRGGDAEAGTMVTGTLRAMGEGAIHDQLAGGFHRYTVDRRWRVPHFEKMLYDNALLAEVLAEAFALGGDPELERLGRRTLDFLVDGMTVPQGGLLASFDAESGTGAAGEEGAYYTWTEAELGAALGAEGAALLAPALGVEGESELPGGRHTLYWAKPEAGLRERAAPHLAELRAARERRPPPRADDKVLTDWNGLAVAALARGAVAFGEPRYLSAARRAAEHLLAEARGSGGDGSLLHASRGGRATIPAFLDDYAFLLHGLLALAEAEAALEQGPAGREGGGPAARGRTWLDAAERVAAELEERLRHPEGGYFFAAAEGELPLRTRTALGRATPAGNAVAVLDLLALARHTGKGAYRERAEAALRAFAHELASYPQAVPDLARALYRFHAPAPARGTRGRAAATPR